MPIDAILHGFAVALEPTNLLFLFVGTLLGTLIGVLPGIGPSTGIALLIPVGFGMSPTPALIMMAGVYYGAMYGGSTTSILLNAPGEAASVMTTLDGYQMARKGRPGAALAIAAIGSFIAGTLGIVALTAVALPVANLALRFGPAEFCALIVFSLVAVAGLSGGHVLKGLVSLVLGLLIATVGIELQSGVSRFTFGFAELDDGIDFLIVVIGLFAVAESLVGIEELALGLRQNVKLTGPVWLTLEEWRRSRWPIVRGAVIGFVTGVLPGAGSTVASVIAYTTEKRLARRPEEFGRGAIEGVAGPESANNAASMGSMVPLLTLGIPGSNATAIMLGALMMYGLQPGPLLFKNQPDLVWGLIASMYFGNLILLVLNLPLVRIFVKVVDVPPRILLPLVIGLSFIGVYSINSSTIDLVLLAAFGVLGYVFRKLEVPAAPLVMGVVLGNLLEQSMRQALAISAGSYAIFLERPIAAVLFAAALLLLIVPPLWRCVRRPAGEGTTREPDPD
jgi:putative tricarboxylic transport membrane protein